MDLKNRARRNIIFLHFLVYTVDPNVTVEQFNRRSLW